MNYNRDPRSYRDIAEILQKALDSPKGLEATFPSSSLASHFLFRCNAYRQLDRTLNAEIYPPHHEMHGFSVYDELIIHKERGSPVVTIGRRSKPDLKLID